MVSELTDARQFFKFNSGRTLTLDRDLVDELSKRNTITQWQIFQPDDGNRFGFLINMNLVETVKVVDDD